MGKRFLNGAADSLNFMSESLQDKRPAQRWHRLTHRMLTDLQHRYTTRTAAEEWNLASNWHPQDVTSAEFVRTYMSEAFPGGQLARRLEQECSCDEQRSVQKMLPVIKLTEESGPRMLRHFEDLYGYRGNNQYVYFLSPWEFHMFWEVLPLPKPGSKDCDEDTPEDNKVHPVSLTKLNTRGDDFDINPDAECRDVVFYPDLEVCRNLRKQWYMHRRHRPMVPAPQHTPMPDKQIDVEGKSRLFSLYLRPWVLSHSQASAITILHVEHMKLACNIALWNYMQLAAGCWLLAAG